MAIELELEVGKQYITRDGTEYTAPLKQLTDSFFGGLDYIATTYKIGTEVSIATRTWTHDGSWVRNVENDLDLVAEYNPEEIRMIGKVIVNIEAGKTYRTREGKEVTLETEDTYILKGSNGFLYNKSLTGSVYSYEQSEFDIVEEVAKEPVTTFTTQQEIYKHLASGGYVSCDGGEYIYGFAEEGVLSTFDRYGRVLEQEGPYFNYPSGWQVATIEPKPVPRWEDALKDKKILCWVGDNENRLDILAFVMSFTERHTYPYLVESDDGDVYAFAVPLTLEEVTNYIYECE
jgi:hypothetical protein